MVFAIFLYLGIGALNELGRPFSGAWLALFRIAGWPIWCGVYLCGVLGIEIPWLMK